MTILTPILSSNFTETIMKTFAVSVALSMTALVAPVHAKPMAVKAAPVKCTAVTPAQVSGWFDTFNGAWATKDPAKVTALFASDAVLLATVSNTPRTTPAMIEDYFVKFLKSSPVGSIDTSTIRIGCNSAYRLGTWTVKLTDAASGKVTDVKARYSFIYKRERGVWKIEHLHSSMMPEPTS
jgi:uncharacterized protein (TIGR02246 family)